MKNKINLRLVGIALLAIIATALSVTFVYYSLFQKQIRAELYNYAQLLRDTRYFEAEDLDPTQLDLSENLDNLRITWVDQDGKVLYDNDTDASKMENHGDRPEIQQAFEEGEGQSVRLSDTMKKNTFYYAVLLDNGTVMRVATEAESIWSVFYSVLPLLLALILVIIAVCIALSHMLTRQLITPIETMAKNIEDANVITPYKELVPFANMIRQQHTDILSAAKARQDFTANVSHELKTPLTAISGYAELLENHMVDETQSDHFAAEIRKNSQRLLNLINDIIRLSELDRSETGPGFESLDLNQVVGDCMEALRINADNRHVSLTYQGETCMLHANREMMRELTDNLVQNAIRYNNEGGHVWVSVTNEDGSVLTVRDDGIGIPQEDQARVFERFYRVDKSRSKETGGTGLGLAIVKHIVELHEAKITLKSQPGQGTEIQVKF